MNTTTHISSIHIPFYSLFLTLFVVGLLSSCSGKKNYDTLVEQYLVPYSPSADLDVESVPTPSWAIGMSKYEEGDYKAMEEAFSKLQPGNAYYYKAHYVMGLVALQQHQPLKAIDQFKSVRSNTRAKYFRDAQWYIALAYLQAGIPARTKDILHAILDDETHHYRTKARELLKQLE